MITVVLSALGTCMASADTPESGLIPFDLGREWIYTKVETHNDGSKKRTEHHEKIVAVVLLDDEMWYVADAAGFPVFSRNAADGVHDARTLPKYSAEFSNDGTKPESRESSKTDASESLELSTPEVPTEPPPANATLEALVKKAESHLLFKYPTKAGDRVDVSYKDDGSHDETITIDTEMNVKVPYGRFKCVVYDYVQGAFGSRTRFYIAPGVGVVKWEALPSSRSGDNADATPDGEPEAVSRTVWELIKVVSPKIKK